MRHAVNLGYGCAIQTAAKYALAAGYDAVVFFDGDGQHSGADVPVALALVTDGRANVAVGSRFLGSCGYRIPFSRRIGIVVFRTLLRSLSGLRVTDPTSGLQALDRRAMRVCASESFSTAFPDADMLLLYHRAGLTVTEFPGSFRRRASGESMHSPGSVVRYVYKMTVSMLAVALTQHKHGRGRLMFAQQAVVGALLGAAILAVIVDLVLRRKLAEERAVIWLIAGVLTFVVSLSGALQRGLGTLLGSTNGPATILAVGVLFLLAICLDLSVQLTRQVSRAKNATQEQALLEQRVERLERMQRAADEEPAAGDEEPVAAGGVMPAAGDDP